MAWLTTLLLFSCVSKGSHELVEVQLDATRTALNARNASSYKEVAALEAELEAQREELARLMENNTALVERLDQQGRELDKARGEIGHLASQTRDEEGEQLVAATAQEIQDALSALSHTEFQTKQRMRRYLEWKEQLSALEAEGRVTVLPEGPRTVIRVPTKQIFNEGRVSISPRGEVLLKSLSEVLAARGDHTLEVMAHTDNKPYHTADFDSSWELAFAQAMTVLRTLENAGVTHPISASSAAGSYPIADNGTAEGRDMNRRVEIIIFPTPPTPPAADREDKEAEEDEGQE